MLLRWFSWKWIPTHVCLSLFIWTSGIAWCCCCCCCTPLSIVMVYCCWGCMFTAWIMLFKRFPDCWAPLGTGGADCATLRLFPVSSTASRMYSLSLLGAGRILRQLFSMVCELRQVARSPWICSTNCTHWAHTTLGKRSFSSICKKYGFVSQK